MLHPTFTVMLLRTSTVLLWNVSIVLVWINWVWKCYNIKLMKRNGPVKHEVIKLATVFRSKIIWSVLVIIKSTQLDLLVLSGIQLCSGWPKCASPTIRDTKCDASNFLCSIIRLGDKIVREKTKEFRSLAWNEFFGAQN